MKEVSGPRLRWLGAAIGFVVCLLGGAPAKAQEKGGIDYVSGEGMIACPTPDFAEARAAIGAHDAKWLQSTGCFAPAPGSRLVIVSGHDAKSRIVFSRFETAEKAWRVRVYLEGDRGVTAFVQPQYSAVGPKFLEMAATIYLDSAIPALSKSAAEDFIFDFKRSNRFLAEYVTIEAKEGRGIYDDEPIEAWRGVWSVVATGLTVSQAIGWCDRAKMPRFAAKCLVKID
jgi:hypothetical protein